MSVLISNQGFGNCLLIVTGQMGTKSSGPASPGSCTFGAGSILDQGTNKGFKKPTPYLSMFLWGLKGMKWGLHAFSGYSLVSGEPVPTGCPAVLQLCLSLCLSQWHVHRLRLLAASTFRALWLKGADRLRSYEGGLTH